VNIDSANAARYAIVAICLVLVGAILTLGPVSVEQRAAVLAGIVSVLLVLGYQRRRDG